MKINKKIERHLALRDHHGIEHCKWFVLRRSQQEQKSFSTNFNLNETMASRADRIDRFPNKININVLKIQQLVNISMRIFHPKKNVKYFLIQKSPRAEPLTAFLRFEYNEGQFSESGKFEVTDGSSRPIEHVAILSTNAADPAQMDDLGQKPVLSKPILSIL